VKEPEKTTKTEAQGTHNEEKSKLKITNEKSRIRTLKVLRKTPRSDRLLKPALYRHFRPHPLTSTSQNLPESKILFSSGNSPTRSTHTALPNKFSLSFHRHIQFPDDRTPSIFITSTPFFNQISTLANSLHFLFPSPTFHSSPSFSSNHPRPITTVNPPLSLNVRIQLPTLPNRLETLRRVLSPNNRHSRYNPPCFSD
jgi:hypothetical protein